YRDQIPAKVFPQCGIKDVRLKKLGSFDTQGLEDAGVHIECIKEPESRNDILLVNQQTFEQPNIQSHIAAGGKVLCLAGKTKQTRPQSQIIDTFHDIQGQLNTTRGIDSPANCTWYGWSANQPVMIKQQHNDLQQEAGRLSFNGINEAGAYAYAILKRPLLQANEGHVYLKYLNDSENWQTKLHQNANFFDRTMGILLRDHKHNWFLSSQATPLNLTGKNGYSDASLGEMDWLAVNTASDGMLHSTISTNKNIVPDWQTITGIGLYLYQLPAEAVDFSIAKIQFKGRGAPSALIPLHGPKHRLLNHIDQQDLSFWPNGACSGILPLPERSNTRVILAGNHDGMGASLYEQFHGKGVAIVTSLNLNQLNDVPTASAIFDNIITYLKQYQPEQTSGTYTCVNVDLNQYLNQMDVFRESDINQANSIITDGQSIQKVMDQNLNELVKEGSTLLICNINESSIDLIRKLTGQNLKLTQPYLDERKHCVKAAISWTKADTPNNLVEYYQGIMIPQPFETNHEPLLSGISNLDLNWDGQDMFEYGIEIKGKDPVRANDDYAILISNWKIDWSKPHWGGEYIHAAKDLKRADWFINRDPVVLRIKHGQGQIILCQLDFLHGNKKARRIMAQLLTNLNCSMGYPTNFASTDTTFDLSEKAKQIERFNQHYQFLPPAVRQHYGVPKHLQNQPQSTVIKKAAFQLIADTFALQYAPYLVEELWESYVVMTNKQSAGNTSETLTYVQQHIETWEHQAQVFQLSVGLEDLKRKPNGQPAVDLDTFASNLQQIINLLAKNGAKLYWTPIIAVPVNLTDYSGDLITQYNRVAQNIMDEHDVYTNDLYHFMLEQFPEYLQNDNVTLDMTQQQILAKQVAQAIVFFGAQ
ncbi:MAG TPA: hypothetical protein DER01_07865, partial [Phycisphaerales bacterium]|nr:hypothetical protein [Phycisphaerales bacterium]